MKSFRMPLLVLAVLACFPLLAGAATLEETEAKILEAFAKVKSMTADIAMELPQDPQMPLGKMSIAGTLTLVVEGDAAKYAQDLTMSMEAEGQKQEMKMDMLYDGEFLYTVNEAMGQKNATKARAGKNQDFPPPGSKMLLEFLKEDFNLSLADDKEIDGTSCYVLEGAPKSSDTGMKKLIVYIGKEDGVPRQMDIYQDGLDKPALMRYSNIKLNPEVSKDKFVFKAPEGVEVTDLTQAAPQLQLDMDIEDTDGIEGDAGSTSLDEGGDGSLKLKNAEP